MERLEAAREDGVCPQEHRLVNRPHKRGPELVWGDRPSWSGWIVPALSLVLGIDNALTVDVAGLGHGRAGAAEGPLPPLCLLFALPQESGCGAALMVHLITDPA